MRPRISIIGCVRRSVGWSRNAFVKSIRMLHFFIRKFVPTQYKYSVYFQQQHLMQEYLFSLRLLFWAVLSISAHVGEHGQSFSASPLVLVVPAVSKRELRCKFWWIRKQRKGRITVKLLSLSLSLSLWDRKLHSRTHGRKHKHAHTHIQTFTF